jgi:hypothetical protein
MNELTDIDDINALEADYLKQYPNAENPVYWHEMVDLEDIINFMINRKGRRIEIEMDPNILDKGVLVYV